MRLLSTHRTVRTSHLLVIATIAATLAASQFLYVKLRDSQVTAFNDRIESIVLSLDRTGGHYIEVFDWPLLEGLVEQAKNDSIVESVQIEDLRSENTFGKLPRKGENQTRYFARDIRRDGTTIGRIHLVVNEGGLIQALSWLRGFLGLSVATIALMVGGLAYFTTRRNYEKRLQQEANYDSLTGLVNRRLFNDRLDQAIRLARRDESVVALLFIDLDHFKKVNDSMGHNAGDVLLIEVAKRFLRVVREHDTIAKLSVHGEDDTIARLGGDEFTIILQGMRTPRDAEVVADRLIKVCGEPFSICGLELFVSASIGIAIHPHDSADSASMLRNADAAMYAAKEAGRETYRFFTTEMNVLAEERLEMENDLRRALNEGELELYYQPLIDVSSDTVRGAEALLRWNSRSRGMVSPGEFIPLAEETGVIVQIGEWVVRTACEQAAQWRRRFEVPLYVSVNISTEQIKRSDLVAVVTRALRDFSLPPELLKLEITESVLMQDTEGVRETLQAIHDLGVRFSIDDFGTGYSSLSYLRCFPFETLKVDRSFVMNVTSNENDACLVDSIIAMARNLGLNVVAEGIETKEQYTFVKNSGAQVAQGYCLGRPVPAADLTSAVTRCARVKVKAVG